MLLTRKKYVAHMYIQFRLKKVLTMNLSPYLHRKCIREELKDRCYPVDRGWDWRMP